MYEYKEKSESARGLELVDDLAGTLPGYFSYLEGRNQCLGSNVI